MAKTAKDAEFDVIGLGVIAIDILMRLPRLPDEGSKVFATSAAMQGGGLVATALVAVSRLGGRARIFGCLGQSRFAEQALDDLSREGIDVARIRRKPGAEPVVAVVMVDERNGQRTIVASFNGVTYPSPDEVPLEDVGAARCVLVDQEGGDAAVALAQAARAAGVPVVVDLETINASTDALVACASDVVVGESFARRYTGAEDRREAIDSLWRRGERTSVVVTCGAEGASYRTREGLFHQPAFAVPVVDTTGCGDVFHGAFALCRARGAPIVEAVAFSSAVAALKTRCLGGRAGIPSAEDVRRFRAGAGDAGPRRL
jgi:sulfofructose kinase